jgi:heme-degrading monooxygenase HmoA
VPSEGHGGAEARFPTAPREAVVAAQVLSKTPMMITRLWRGWTRIDNAEAYERFLLGELFPSMREIPGFRGADVLRRVEDEGVAFITLTRFDSVDAIRAFAGDDYETAVLELQARALLSRYESERSTSRLQPSRPDRHGPPSTDDCERVRRAATHACCG